MLRLIETYKHESYDIIFYEGIDFDMIRNHSDESSEFLVFYIESWKSEVDSYKREKRIEELLGGEKDLFDPELIKKNTVAIYLTNGYLEPTHHAIKKKLIEPQSWKNWLC
jgi:hypothetical protein